MKPLDHDPCSPLSSPDDLYSGQQYFPARQLTQVFEFEAIYWPWIHLLPLIEAAGHSLKAGQGV